MNKVFLFTDGSFMAANCIKNKSNTNFGSYAFVFNHNNKARGGAGLIPHASDSTYCEFVSIRNGVESIARVIGSNVEVVIITDHLATVNYINAKCVDTTKRISKNTKTVLIRNLIKVLLATHNNMTITSQHVKSHVKVGKRNAFHEYNEYCDKAAKVISRAERKRRNTTKCEINTGSKKKNLWAMSC